MDILEKIGKIFRKKSASTRAELMAAFEKRYASFRELLQANADLAAVFSQLNGAISGERAMETSEVRKSARRACLLAERMSECLNAISGQRYAALASILKRNCAAIPAAMSIPLRCPFLKSMPAWIIL